MSHQAHRPNEFADSPFVVFCEVTRTCAFDSKHCRAIAQPHRHPPELTDEQSITLVDDLASFPAARRAPHEAPMTQTQSPRR